MTHATELILQIDDKFSSPTKSFVWKSRWISVYSEPENATGDELMFQFRQIHKRTKYWSTRISNASKLVMQDSWVILFRPFGASETHVWAGHD